ncbi:DUF3883 domain-containing protein [Pedobacter sp. SYSU D00535]|uniref:DUF3883 domain-containing protein n=1 Tax=Pedobacter sp. SYSU D00535 TaxID=2810308 RepID=UPI001A97880B|nr:DUF3883 domain-containing protein [Pedobacter sp. SYSU D00535]
MNDRLLFLNTGWMDLYQGLANDSIRGGGKHVQREGWGGEVYNFKPHRGNCYAYVQPKIDRKYNNPSTIKLEKLGGSKSDQKIEGITVVWTASDPDNGGTKIVGWFRNATVYRTLQDAPSGSGRLISGASFGYFVSAKVEDCTLLPKDNRVKVVERAKKGWMGQSNVWYADQNPDFVREVRAYIKNRGVPPVPNPPRQPDTLRRIEVEKAAVDLVTRHFTSLEYQVESVERDNVGWDLEARRERLTLKIEVKGLSGKEVVAELTANEYKKMKEFQSEYRLCIVTSALENPTLHMFYYSVENLAWIDEKGRRLGLEEKVSATAFIS